MVEHEGFSKSRANHTLKSPLFDDKQVKKNFTFLYLDEFRAGTLKSPAYLA